MKQGNQLMAHRPGFEQLHIPGKGGIRKGVDQMNAKTIIPEQKIADAEDENFLGRRRNASPELFI